MIPVMCASGKEALSYINNNRYNFEICLLDICMPEMSGVELAKKIKHTNPLLPLIALSSAVDYINTSDFDAKLDKPINKLQLFHEIYKIISQHVNDSAFIGEMKESPNLNYRRIQPIVKFNENLKILIAEDEVVNQTVISDMLKNIGYKNFSMSSDGQEAIEKIDIAFNKDIPYEILIVGFENAENRWI